MSSDNVLPPAEPEPAPVVQSRSLVELIATSNPFYVISAALFLFGLRMSFAQHQRETDSWALMGGLAGYTLLLAGAALLLVRFARVWNDVRTVLLLVVLMFLATSVTFDELLVLNPERGQWFFAGGLVFASALTELILRGIRLKLPLLFKLPYHGVLALFFLYPLLLAREAHNPHGELLLWGLWGFAPAAGLIFLTLLPAVWRGANYTRDNGSPWPWPFYPWSVFVFLAVAVCGRAFLLCWSFHLLPSGDLVFGPYFLAPFVLALAVVALELGISSRSRVTSFVALALPFGAVLLSGAGHHTTSVYAEFLRHFEARLGGTPLFVALVAASVFYTCAWVRGVRFASEGLTAALVGLAFFRPGALDLVSATAPQWAVLVAAVSLQVTVALLRRDWWRAAFGAVVLSAWLGLVVWRAYRALRAEIPGLDYLVLGLLLLPLAVAISLHKGGVFGRHAASDGLPPPSA